jgi:two-component system phosphate regulon sensor histidine kinase PhoR
MNIQKLSKTLMISTIILIAAFQCYWITRLYKDEWSNLKKETDVMFRDVIYKLQLQRFKSDSNFVKVFAKNGPDNLFAFNVLDSVREKIVDSVWRDSSGRERHVFGRFIDGLRHDSFPEAPGERVMISEEDSFNMPFPPPGFPAPNVKYIFRGKINDSLPLKKIDSAFEADLNRSNITVPFVVKVVAGRETELRNSVKPDELKTNFTFVGLSNSYAYQAEFSNPFAYILGKIKFQILVSFLLIAITVLSFMFLYRNLLAQRRLAQMKNEFISNITHELKTPIATVNVAIEALRNFNAIQNPEKTKEYLDISASELQRLSMLVDKVLRLSMFESKEIKLFKEWFDLKQLTEEVINTLKLQSEKKNATIELTADENDFAIHADKLHFTSVLYNLVDNALKYSKEKIEIKVSLQRSGDIITLCVLDNGIGIQQEYKAKIFEKFFRVPTNDTHNTKGYGLGLSYVNEIIKRHQGFITVESGFEKGSAFIVKFPVEEKPVIRFDEHRVIRRIEIGVKKRKTL